jgi:hypothetical protein
VIYQSDCKARSSEIANGLPINLTKVMNRPTDPTTITSYAMR